MVKKVAALLLLPQTLMRLIFTIPSLVLKVISSLLSILLLIQFCSWIGMNDDSKRNNGKFIDFNENEHRSIKGLRLTTNLT